MMAPTGWPRHNLLCNRRWRHWVSNSQTNEHEELAWCVCVWRACRSSGSSPTGQHRRASWTTDPVANQCALELRRRCPREDFSTTTQELRNERALGPQGVDGRNLSAFGEYAEEEDRVGDLQDKVHHLCSVPVQVTEGEVNDIVCNSSANDLEAHRKIGSQVKLVDKQRSHEPAEIGDHSWTSDLPKAAESDGTMGGASSQEHSKDRTGRNTFFLDNILRAKDDGIPSMSERNKRLRRKRSRRRSTQQEPQTETATEPDRTADDTVSTTNSQLQRHDRDESQVICREERRERRRQPQLQDQS